MRNFLELPKLELTPGARNALLLASIPLTWWSFDSYKDGEVALGFLATLITLALLAATVIMSEMARSKEEIESARPGGLGDFNFPTATQGRVVPLVWGRAMLKGPNVVWYGDLRPDAITEKVKTGFFSSKRITKGFRYHVGIQMALCRGGEGDARTVLKRAFIGGKEVFDGNLATDGGTFDVDEPDLHGGDDLGHGGVQATVDYYTGTTTQPVSAYLQQHQDSGAGTDRTPRYTGTTYVVVRELGVAAATARGAYVGNSTSIQPWSLEVERFPALFSGQTAGQNAIGVDANPMNVLYELLTNDEWGFGLSSSDIDVGGGSSFLAASTTLISEINGFGLVLTRAMDAGKLKEEIERQINGVVFLDHASGKWKVKLARFDYDIDTVPQFTDGTVKTVKNFSRGSWEDTVNQITVKFFKRDDDYVESYALAQDTANAIMQGGGSTTTVRVVSEEPAYPGVKRSSLANEIAWRDLRAKSQPLARATFIVDRTFWQVTIGDVVAWTSSRFDLTKLPMRVTGVDYGRLDRNEITVTAVQDAFAFLAPSFGDPPATGWVAPTIDLLAFPSDEQLAFEVPRAILVRDPDFAGDDSVSKVMAAARRQGSETAFEILQRNSSGTPSGSFITAGDVLQFMLVGELSSSLGAGVANPTSTITVVPDPNTQAEIEAAFDDDATLVDLGSDLVHMVMVGSEFMLVDSAANNASNVDLQNVYRGALDSVQGNHASGAKVYLLHVGAGLTDTTFPDTNNVDIELRMRSPASTFSGSVTTISPTMDKRPLRPYAPNASLYNGGSTPFGTPDLEGDGGAGENTFGFDVDWRRRRYDTADEVQELLADFTPDASTEFQVRVFVDPDGANAEIDSSPFGWATGTGPEFIPRLEIIQEAAAGTEIRVEIEARHDIGTETDLRSRADMIHDVVPTTALSGLFYLGGNLRANDVSNSFVVADAGVHTVRIGAAYSTSNVEARINGGSFSTIITAGGTSGTTASLSVSDTIELRHTTNETPDPQFVEIENPSATRVAYGALSA